jgi:tetratricopeptide (TPR) repeat protein
LEAWVEQLSAQPTDDAARAFVIANPERHTCKSAEEIHAAVLELAYADRERALRLTAAINAVAEASGDILARALAERCNGHVLYAGSSYTEALKHYTVALALLEGTPHELEVGRTLNSALQSLIHLGEFDRAYTWAARARGIFQRHGDELRLARLTSNMGNILYRQDRHDEAIELYQQALATLRRIGAARDVAAALSNIAVCRTSLGDYPLALEAYREVRRHCEQHGLTQLVSAADYNIAYLHFLRADFLKAIELYRDTRIYCEKSGDRYHAALCDLDEAELYLELNLTSEGLELAERAAKGFEQLGMNYERAKAISNAAIAAMQLGKSKRAIRLFHTARRLFIEQKNDLWPAILDVQEGFLCWRKGKLRRAAQLCRRAHLILGKSALPGKAILCDLLRARILLSSGRLDLAERVVRRLTRPGRREHMSAHRAHLWLLRGQLQDALDQPERALKSYERARGEVEEVRGRLWGEEPRIAYLKDKLPIYERLFELYVAHGDTGKAFACVEEAKSRSMAERLALDKLLPPLAVPDGGSAGASLATIQEAVPLDAILIEYYEAGGAFYAFLVSRNSIDLIRCGNSRRVHELVRLFEFQVSKFRLDSGYLRTFQHAQQTAVSQHLQELYAELIAPFAGQLEGYTRMIVVPHSVLHGLPMHALCGKGRFLADEFALSYAPSASVFTLCMARPPSRDIDESLVMAVPDEHAPEIESEGRAVAAAMPKSRLLLNTNATKDALQRLGPKSRFIHIATHGLFRHDNPLFSSIRLSDSRLTVIDLAQIPLSADLVTLSGCSTGLNAVVGADELMGLARGLMYSGARSILVSLWDVSDKTTTEFMSEFYCAMSTGMYSTDALRKAMYAIRERHPHPYHWAPFILIGKS